MNLLRPEECCILNSGRGAWAFQPLANRLARVLGVDVSETPRRFNYVLGLENPEREFPQGASFIPLSAIERAADKRLIAEAFLAQGVPAPRAVLAANFAEALRWVEEHSDLRWCLKYPTSCGASGHRMVHVDSVEPRNWPRPFVVQEFIPLARPEVFRIYSGGEEVFGWVVRRFPDGVAESPWVAHARGARYEDCGEAPLEAMAVAQKAIAACGLGGSFGCVDLLQRATGEWLALEAGTDGIFNHVDRDLGGLPLEEEIDRRIAEAFFRNGQRMAAAGVI